MCSAYQIFASCSDMTVMQNSLSMTGTQGATSQAARDEQAIRLGIVGRGRLGQRVARAAYGGTGAGDLAARRRTVLVPGWPGGRA